MKIVFALLTLVNFSTMTSYTNFEASPTKSVKLAMRTDEGMNQVEIAKLALGLEGWACSDCAKACSQRGYPYYCANPPQNCCECTRLTQCSICNNVC